MFRLIKVSLGTGIPRISLIVFILRSFILNAFELKRIGMNIDLCLFLNIPGSVHSMYAFLFTRTSKCWMDWTY